MLLCVFKLKILMCFYVPGSQSVYGLPIIIAGAELGESHLGLWLVYATGYAQDADCSGANIR